MEQKKKIVSRFVYVTPLYSARAADINPERYSAAASRAPRVESARLIRPGARPVISVIEASRTGVYTAARAWPVDRARAWDSFSFGKSRAPAAGVRVPRAPRRPPPGANVDHKFGKSVVCANVSAGAITRRTRLGLFLFFFSFFFFLHGGSFVAGEICFSFFFVWLGWR